MTHTMEETYSVTGHFLQQDTMDELAVDSTCTHESLCKKMLTFTMHQKAVVEMTIRSFVDRRLNSIATSLSIVRAILQQIFSHSRSSKTVWIPC